MLRNESVEIDGSVGDLTETVPHYSYRDWDDREQRIASYTTLWAAQQRKRGKTTSPIGPFLRGTWKFLRGFLLKKGFLDGAIGWKVAWSNAREVFLKYRKLRTAHEQSSPDSH